MTVHLDEKRPRAAILGCAGPTLTEEETFFFEQMDPLGFILFARNCVDPDQVKALVKSMRAAVGRDDAPVLIDQEGGRVQRLGPPHWKVRPAQSLFARIAEDDRALAREAASINARLIAEELILLGIDVDCLPVMDVPTIGAHEIIGDRAFGMDPEIVSELGQSVITGLGAGGVTAVVKHLPGHGRANADSHLALPYVDAGKNALRRTDFLPFKNARFAPWGMTAHVVYEAFDPMRPATLSETMIMDVIRGEIGFQGFLVSDDISMKALSGRIEVNALAALEAGCDAVLHCNGDMHEMHAIMRDLPEMTGIAWERFQTGLAVRPASDPIDVPALEAELAKMTANWAAVEV